MASIIATTRRAPTLLPRLAESLAVPAAPTTPRRSHQTAARTKRALRIRPHPSHLLRNDPASATDEIVFNPPESQPSPYHTPFKFLPPSDPRRANNLKLLFGNDASGSSTDYVPPEMKKSWAKSYHLTKEDVEELKRLRWEDPETWTVSKLAEKFKCSTKFVRIVGRVPESYRAKVQEEKRRKMATWGPKKLKAFEEKGERIRMLFRGEL